MDSTYEIFRDDPQGAIWVESVVGLDQAIIRLAVLCKEKPGSYFAYHAGEARVVARFPVESRATQATA